MTLAAAILTDATTVFCNTTEFAEPVVYWKRGAAAGRNINAVVIRQQLSTVGEDGGETILPSSEVHVANHSTTGIASTELNLGGDQIAIPPRDGQPAMRKTILQLITQDRGMLVFECR
jgi:hypothetical protein